MLLVKLVRVILNALRHPEHKDQPMTKAEAEMLVKEMAARRPEANDLDTDKSVTDVCVALGLDSSFSARGVYARQLGLGELYGGTADQNLWLRDMLLEKVAADDVASLRD